MRRISIGIMEKRNRIRSSVMDRAWNCMTTERGCTIIRLGGGRGSTQWLIVCEGFHRIPMPMIIRSDSLISMGCGRSQFKFALSRLLKHLEEVLLVIIEGIALPQLPLLAWLNHLRLTLQR